jgi:photosystem II stability/assembly factor-like uncharacterized protein
MAIKTEFRQEVRKITEWRDGCVWKTRVVGHVWVAQEELDDPARSTEIARANDGDMLTNMPVGTPFDEFQRSFVVKV